MVAREYNKVYGKEVLQSRECASPSKKVKKNSKKEAVVICLRLKGSPVR
jgi:hypothetical protein